MQSFSQRFAIVIALAVFAPAAGVAADPGLLRLVMPDAKVVAGLQVTQAKNSAFGQYILSHMQPDDRLQKLMIESDFDPRRDLTEVLMASNAASDLGGHWLVLARGSFHPSGIAALAVRNGGTSSSFQGVDILSGPAVKSGEPDTALAFLDSTVLVAGDPELVRAAIERSHANIPNGLTMAGKIAELSAKYDFWFFSLLPVSEFADVMPDPNVGEAVKDPMMQSIQQASGGVKFGPIVRLAAQAVTRSDQDAASLAQVLQFLGSLLQANKKKDATGQVSAAIAAMQVKAVGNITSLSLELPESQVQQILDSAVNGKAARKQAPAANH